MVFDYKGVGILQNESELKLLSYMFDVNKIKNYLEIGTYLGGTMVYFDDLIKDGFLCSIDMTEAYKTTFSKNNISLKNKHMFITGNSFDESTINKVRDLNLEFDMLFIDGDHESDSALKDYQNYSKFVRKGGLIVFDDIRYPSVRECYNIALGKDADSNIILSDTPSFPNYNGFGIIRK